MLLDSQPTSVCRKTFIFSANSSPFFSLVQPRCCIAASINDHPALYSSPLCARKKTMLVVCRHRVSSTNWLPGTIERLLRCRVRTLCNLEHCAILSLYDPHAVWFSCWTILTLCNPVDFLGWANHLKSRSTEAARQFISSRDFRKRVFEESPLNVFICEMFRTDCSRRSHTEHALSAFGAANSSQDSRSHSKAFGRTSWNVLSGLSKEPENDHHFLIESKSQTSLRHPMETRRVPGLFLKKVFYKFFLLAAKVKVRGD